MAFCDGVNLPLRFHRWMSHEIRKKINAKLSLPAVLWMYDEIC
jgi:hypothetical protein